MDTLVRFLTLSVLMGWLSVSWAQPTPPGWRLPTTEELSDKDRDDSPTRYAKASADFNGDGVADEAILLKSTSFSGEALWVRLSAPDKGFSWVKLAQIDWGKQYPTVPLAMGVEVTPPGTYAYGCFADSKECNLGRETDRPKLKLRDPSIHYFKFESASSAFFWSYKYKRFLEVVISD